MITKEEKELFPIFKSKEELEQDEFKNFLKEIVEKDGHKALSKIIQLEYKKKLEKEQKEIEELQKEERNKEYENEWSCVENTLCDLEEYTIYLEKLNTNDPFHYHTDDEWCRNKNIVKRIVDLADKFKSIEVASNPPYPV